MATSSLVTSLLFLDYSPQTIVASVVGADALATTYILNCPPGTDGNDCGIYNQSLTLGPWASATPPPGAPSTGVLDMYVTMPGGGSDGEGFEFSAHCEMTRTVASECTIINNGGNNDGTPTVTLKNGEELDATGLATMTYYPVTITAGLEKLEAAASSTGSESSESSGAADDDSAAGSRFGGLCMGSLLAGVALVGVAVNLV